MQAVALQPPIYQGRGQPRKLRPAPLYTVKELIESLPTSVWQTISWREGTKGMMQVQAVAIRVHWATGSSLHSTSHSPVYTGPEGWLLTERSRPQVEADEQETQAADKPGEKPAKTKYWFSTLPSETSLERLVTLTHACWVIEQFYEDAKQECGFDHYQGRRWDGLHRHLALVMLAYSFLMFYRLTLPLPFSGAFSPASREARCLPCIARCCSGCSWISFSGCSTPSRSNPSAPEETNKVILAGECFPQTAIDGQHAACGFG